MGDELKGFEETAPTLTLEPDLGEAKPAAPAVPEAEGVKGFNAFMDRYMKGLGIERAAVESEIW